MPNARGDCRPLALVLISRLPNGTFNARRMCEIHNGGNCRELRRIMDEHPGERECIVDNRVLGFLAPTRGTYVGIVSLSDASHNPLLVSCCTRDMTLLRLHYIPIYRPLLESFLQSVQPQETHG